MSFILRIARSAVLSVLKEWMLLKDICKLDSALCNCDERKPFLALLEQPSFALHGDREHKFGVSVIEWLTLRQISVRNIRLHEREDREALSLTLKSTGKLFALLKCLVLFDCDTDGDENVQQIIKYAGVLEEIRVEMGSKISVESLVKNLSGTIKKIEFYRCEMDMTGQTLKNLGVHCLHLQELSMRTCALIDTDNNLLNVACLNGLAENCPQLNSLTVCSSRLFQDDNSTNQLSTSFPALTYLNLSGSRGTKGSILVGLVTACPALTTLEVSSCDLLTDEHIESITVTAKSLTDLSITSCPLLTNKTLQSIAINCGQMLLRLSAGYSKNISDVGITVIAEHCHILQSLRLNNSVKVTDESILSILTQCPELQQLAVWGCAVSDAVLLAIEESHNDTLAYLLVSLGGPSNVTRDGLKSLRAARPGLKMC